jgi:hypothetical protein
MVLEQLSVFAIALGLSCNPSSPVKTQRSAVDKTVGEPTVERNSNGTRKTFPASPSDVPGKMHVFRYADFGPQALAGTNGFGDDCYGDCCCSEPSDSFDVRVVVYQGVTEPEVKQRFSSDPDRGEYRYMPADEAKKFIADSVKDIAQNAAEDGLESLLTTLHRTSQQLATLFP